MTDENMLAPQAPALVEDDINILKQEPVEHMIPSEGDQLRVALKDDLTDPTEPNSSNFLNTVHTARQGFVQEMTDKLGDITLGIDERVEYARRWASEVQNPTAQTEELAVTNAGLVASGAEPMQMSDLEAEQAAVQARIDDEVMRTLSENRPEEAGGGVGLAAVPGQLVDITAEVIDPFSMQGILSVAKAVGIETSWTDRFNPGEVLLKLRARADAVVKSRDQVAIKAFFDAVGRSVKDTAALSKIPGMADAGGLNQWMLADYIFSGRGHHSKFAAAMEGKTATNVYNALDIVTLGLSGAVRKGVSAIARKVIPPTTATSRAASALSRSKNGAEKLITAANSDVADASLARVGTDAAAVINDHVVPKSSAMDNLEGGRHVEKPYYENIYFDKGERLAAKQNAFINGPTLQLNLANIEDIEGGFKHQAMYWDNVGNPFASKQALDAAMGPTGVKYTPVRYRNGGYGAWVEGTHMYEALGDTSTMLMGQRTNSLIANIFGKNVGMDARLIATSDTAVRLTEKAALEMHQTLVPYSKLTGQRAKDLDHVIDYGDRVSLEFTPSELMTMGMDAGQIAGYNSTRKVAKLAYEERNAAIHQLRKEQGQVSATAMVAGKPLAFSGKLVDHTAGLSSSTGRAIDEVLDGATGQMVKVSSLSPTAKVLKVEEGVEYLTRNGTRHTATHVTVAATRGLDTVQLIERAGHVDRRWKAAAYIVAHVKVIENGVAKTVVRAVGTAPSRARASERAAQLNGNLPKGVERYDIKDANEYSGADTLAKLEELGMTRSNRRSDDVLWDTEGRVRLETVSDSLNRMVNSTANQRGFGRWTSVMIARLRNTVSGPDAEKMLGKHGELNVDWVPPTGMQKDQARKVKAQFDYILKVNGLDKANVNSHVAAARDNIAEFFYGAALRVGETNLAGKTLSGFGRLLQTNGEAAIGFAKSSTYVVSLAMNPIRQRIMQASMAPTYMAAEGALKYALSGKWGREQLALGMHMSGLPVSRKLAADLGVGGKDFDKVVEGWKELGYDGLVSGHMFALGTLSDGRIANRGRTGAAVNGFINKLKAHGIDAGVTTDLRSAYLVSLNRFKERNKGRFPKNREEWQEVGAFSSQLALNMNRSDTLMSQKGWASVALQFMAHQFKMSGRIMSGATALIPGKHGRILEEAGFSRAERLRLGGYQALIYGGAGYGVYNLGGQIQEAIGTPIPQEVKTAIDEGAAGYMASKAFEMLVSPNDPVDFAVSESIAPANFARGMVAAITSGHGFSDGIHLTLDQVPATGMAKRFYEAVQMGAAMVGASKNSNVIASGDAWTAAATRTLSAIPLVNNIVKGIALNESGRVVDATGTPVLETAGGAGWVRAAMGITTRDEVGLRAFETELRGAYKASSEEGRIDAINEQAGADWNWIETLVLGQQEDGAWDMPAVYALLDERAAVMEKTLGPIYAEEYRVALQKRAEGLMTNQTKADRLAGNVEKWLNRGNLMATQDLISYTRTLPEFQGKDKVMDHLEFYFGAYQGPESAP